MKRVIVVVVLLAVGVGIVFWVRARSGQRAGPAELQTVRVKRGTVRKTVTADGEVRPLTTVLVKSDVGGRIDLLAVDVGDRVKRGDLIAKIDPTDALASYDQARADLVQAEAALTQAREQAQAQPTLTQTAIVQAEAGYNSTLKDLERLKKATHPQSRAQARSTLDKAKANLEIAGKELTRAQGLKAKGFVPQSDVDTALNRRDLAKAELAYAQERWNTLEQELKADLESAQAKVAQAKAGLERARADTVQDRVRKAQVTSANAQVRKASAQVSNAKTTLGYATVRAPRDGVILQKFFEEGTIITAGGRSIGEGMDIVELGDLSRMFVDVQVDESDIAELKAGQLAEIRIDAFADKAFPGVITVVHPRALSEQNIAAVLVTVEIKDNDPRLIPGMTATCDFLVAQVEDALYLPSRALSNLEDGYVADLLKGEEAIEVPVQVGLEGDDGIEILEGLNEGDEVIIPQLGGPEGAGSDRRREMGRRMGGAGGFVNR